MLTGTNPRAVALLVCVVGLLALTAAGGAAQDLETSASALDTTAAGEAAADDPSVEAAAVDMEGREVVEATEAFPYSAVGTVFPDDSSRTTDATIGHGGTGVMISPRHVLTAGHNVASLEDGEFKDDTEYWFAPGVTQVDGERSVPFGRAHVTEVRVLDDYDGSGDHADDIALLTLDRPMGDEVGHFGVTGNVPEYSVWNEDFYFLGYPEEFQQLEGTASGEGVSDGTHRLSANNAKGDSGGPLFQDPGDPKVHSVMAGYQGLDETATPITPSVRGTLEVWMQEDYAASPSPALYRTDNVGWVEDGEHSVPDSAAPGSTAGPFATTLYNNGLRDANAEVQFYLTSGGIYDGQPDGEPVCTTELTVDALDRSTASCHGELPSDLDEGEYYSVVPYFETTGQEYATTYDRSYTGLDNTPGAGTVQVVDDGDGSGDDGSGDDGSGDDGTDDVCRSTDPRLRLSSVTAPAGTVGEQYTLSAHVQNLGGQGEDRLEVEATHLDSGLEEVVSVETLEFPAETDSELNFRFTLDERYAGDVEFTVNSRLCGDMAATTTFEYPPDVEVQDVHVPDGTVGERVPATVTWSNDGGDGTIDVEVRVEPDQFTTVNLATDRIEVSEGATGEHTVEFVVPEEIQGEQAVVVDPETGESYETTATFEERSDDGTDDGDDGTDDPTVELGPYEPQPHGGDGLYRDVTGSGDVGTQDVSVFQENVFGDAVQNNPELFDFSGTGDVSHGDVIALFQYVIGF